MVPSIQHVGCITYWYGFKGVDVGKVMYMYVTRHGSMKKYFNVWQ
jgi:hypothetical protein